MAIQTKVRETLEKQLELLSERTEKCEGTSELVMLNHAINETLQIILLLDRENRLQRAGRVSLGLASEPPSKES